VTEGLGVKEALAGVALLISEGCSSCCCSSIPSATVSNPSDFPELDEGVDQS